MEFIKDVTWKEVFGSWQKGEASNPSWVELATKVKGFPDWESWRLATANDLKADEKEWRLFRFTDPFNEIPQMLVGPYSGWQSRLPEKNKYSFEELIEIPEQYEFFSQHSGVMSLMDSLPFSTTMIGLRCEDSGGIVCIDGHHRATAMAIIKKQAKKIDFSSVAIDIFIADLPKDEIKLLDEIVKKKTKSDYQN